MSANFNGAASSCKPAVPGDHSCNWVTNGWIQVRFHTLLANATPDTPAYAARGQERLIDPEAIGTWNNRPAWLGGGFHPPQKPNAPCNVTFAGAPRPTAVIMCTCVCAAAVSPES